jgi:GNAT superfamily N-acetyltransferase
MSPAALFTVRPGRPDDAQTLVSLIRELAVYEKLAQYARATPADLRRWLFGPRSYAETLLAEVADEPVGFALFFPTFSTFRGQPGLYLEDIFVQPDHRGKGIGKALIATVAQIGVERGFGRLEWSVLNWNESAIGFYRSLGALARNEWQVLRLADEPLAKLAAQAPKLTMNAEDLQR